MEQGGGADETPFFDEDFIRGGPIELSARERAIESARRVATEQAKALRDLQLEARDMARLRTAKQHEHHHRRMTVALAFVFVVGGGGWWAAGRGGFHRSHPV